MFTSDLSSKNTNCTCNLTNDVDLLSSRLTAQPQEVVDSTQQLHGHVVVHQGVLQHARLEAQVPHVLPHAALAALLIMPGRNGHQRCTHCFIFEQTGAVMNPNVLCTVQPLTF